MIAIYSNNYITDYYIQQLKFPQQYRVYHSREQYIADTAAVKIAFVNHLNSYELPESEEQRLFDVIDGRKFSREINQLKNISDLLFAFDNEMHCYHIDIFQQHTQPNVIWAVPGTVNDNKNVVLWNAHFDLTVTPYRQMLDKINTVEHNKIKPFYFDALLGWKKPHRDFLYESIHALHLQQKIITTYMDSPIKKFDIKKHFVWEPEIKKFYNSVDNFSNTVEYHGHEMSLARILPIQIYNQTAYSIVAETGADNRYCFFTEKTAKPIMARRLFVMFSSRGFLRNLKAIGFKTFDTVIDESYDLIYNDQDRWSAAFEQVQRLCEMDQSTVFAKIASAVEHNYNLLMNTDWNQRMLDQIQEKINSETKIH
jgi:hypothetical protein